MMRLRELIKIIQMTHDHRSDSPSGSPEGICDATGVADVLGVLWPIMGTGVGACFSTP